MLPAWATILIALGASALGGVVGSLLTTHMRIRHERDEQRKGRLLDVATTFASQLAAGRVALQGVERHIRTQRPGEKEWVEMAGAALDEATASAARVALLFGDGSRPAEASRVAVALGRSLLEQLRDPHPYWREVADTQRRLREAETIFNTSVTQEIERIESTPYERPTSLAEALDRLGIE